MSRKAFTLLELLFAILIMGILIALLLPAVAAAMRAGKRASIAAEMQSFGQGIAAFGLAALTVPPSRFIASETGDYSINTLTAPGPLREEIAQGSYGVPWASLTPAQQATATQTIALLAVRTLNDLRTIWPLVNVSRSGPVVAPVIGFYDMNGDGKPNAPYLLSGDECLVFFLGGTPKPFQSSGAARFGMVGFAVNPKNPFLTESYIDPKTNAVVVPARRTVNVEFQSARLVDLDGDGVPSYADSYSGSADPTPYAYFAAVGTGFDPDDCNFTSEPDGTASQRGAFTGLGLGTPGFIASPAPNPYTLGSPIPTTPGDYSAATLATDPTFIAAWANSASYQIICAGGDRQFGIGGWWDGRSNSNKLPFANLANGAATGLAPLAKDARTNERDNITNFSGGPLD